MIIDPTVRQDTTALPSRSTDASSPNARLASLERQAQTLQLALEILSEWLASGVPDSALLANAGEIEGAENDGLGDDEGMDREEEEWGGASGMMDVEDDEMLASDDDEREKDGVEAAGVKQEADGIIRRRRGDTPEPVVRGGDSDDDDAMLDDLAATADSDADDDDDEDLTGEPMNGAESGSVLLATSLPLQLLALSRPITALSFLPATAFTDSDTTKSNGLIGTSAVDASTAAFPAALSTLSEAITTIHVRALEALNNLYVTLSRGKKARRDSKELQEVFETALGLVQGALDAASKYVPPATAESATTGAGKKGKSGAVAAAAGGSGTQKQQEEEADEVQERRREVVMAGMGVVWGCTILGIDPERSGKLVRCVRD